MLFLNQKKQELVKFEFNDYVCVIYMIGPSQSQAPKLNVPKKTKAFVEQAIRERENATCLS